MPSSMSFSLSSLYPPAPPSSKSRCYPCACFMMASWLFPLLASGPQPLRGKGRRKKQGGRGSSCCGAVVNEGTMRLQAQSLASLSGLRIWHCCELWCRLQTRLRYLYSSDQTPSLGTSICCRCGPRKRQKDKNKKTKTKQNKKPRKGWPPDQENQTFPKISSLLLLTSYWPELYHMVTPSCRGSGLHSLYIIPCLWGFSSFLSLGDVLPLPLQLDY